VVRPAGWNKNTIRPLYTVLTDDSLEKKLQQTAKDLTEELDGTPEPGTQPEDVYLEDLSPEALDLVLEPFKNPNDSDEIG
jgi:hypothetical protein